VTDMSGLAFEIIEFLTMFMLALELKASRRGSRCPPFGVGNVAVNYSAE
jgi:hypothetical protein